jgi:hypothetical protein
MRPSLFTKTGDIVMSYSIGFRLTIQLLIAIAVFLNLSELAKAQIVPPDTTVYYETNVTGVRIPLKRPPDSTMIPGEIIIRFRRGSLDSAELMKTFVFYYGMRTKKKGSETPLSDPSTWTGPRGWPTDLRKSLFDDKFFLTNSTNVIKDSSLKSFLISAGGHYLQRLTTASPIDTLSLTRTGDTIGCDHANWMILQFDSTTNPIVLSYFLLAEYPKNVLLAEPCYSGIQLLGVTPKVAGDLYYNCEKGMRDLMRVGTAWHYEVGADSVLVGGYDKGCEYMHPDLGAGVGAGYHVKWAWEYITEAVDSARNQPGHGTPAFGIIGALTNNILSGNQTVAGIAGGWSNLPPDTINPDPMPNGGASLLVFADIRLGVRQYVAAMFEAAAHSTSTLYGLGVHVMNNPVNLYTVDSATGTAPHAAVNYAFENGVSVVAAIDDENYSGIGTISLNYPACFDEPWVLNVGGSIPDKTKTPPSNYGYNMDLLAPSGAIDGCDSTGVGALGWTLNYTTKSDAKGGPYYYGAFAGTSASSSNIAGCVALLRSHAYRRDPMHMLGWEPEDYAGILKASAWRGDLDRVHSDSINFWRPLSGWGHADIGKAFEMLDPDTTEASYSGYEIRHYSDTANFQFSAWTPGDSIEYFFNIPWDQAGGKQYKQRAYLLTDTNGAAYYVRMRTVTHTDTLPNIWDITNAAPLFGWGRSGGMNEKSGWSYALENFQTGWSEITNSTGGDSINEGIFLPHNRIITIRTVQYDVWGYVQGSGWTNYMGHYPPDSMLGVNYTVFGRVKGAYKEAVKETSELASNNRIVIQSTPTDMLTASFYTDAPIEHLTMDIFDALGRQVASSTINHADIGWNKTPISMSELSSGMYVCRISGSNYYQARSFEVVK